MAHAPTDTAPNIWAAAAAGLVAGLAASFVMDRFQAGVAALSSSDSDAEPATEKAADKLSQAVVGHDVPDDRKPLAGQAVHYALGAGLGVVYAVAAEYRPTVTAGYGWRTPRCSTRRQCLRWVWVRPPGRPRRRRICTVSRRIWCSGR